MSGSSRLQFKYQICTLTLTIDLKCCTMTLNLTVAMNMTVAMFSILGNVGVHNKINTNTLKYIYINFSTFTRKTLTLTLKLHKVCSLWFWWHYIKLIIVKSLFLVLVVSLNYDKHSEISTFVL